MSNLHFITLFVIFCVGVLFMFEVLWILKSLNKLYTIPEVKTNEKTSINTNGT